MMINPEFVPVGTVIAYAGEVKDIYKKLEDNGWLVCDGRELEASTFSELFESISTSFGTSYEGVFNIPDLRGLFVRCVTGSSVNDPDANERIALLQGGNTKNSVGSFQGYATGKPTLPFTATITNNNIEGRSLDSGCNTANSGKKGSVNAGANTNGIGGDIETRPKNKYVHYLIKKSRLNQYNEAVVLPIGSIIPFSGPPNLEIQKQYIMCNGDGLSVPGKFQDLFEAIKYVNGKVGDKFNVPDYRGYFLRGVDDQAVDNRRDKQADERTATFPERDKEDAGNSGNLVGSVQSDATAYPISSGFFTKIPYLPTSQGNQAISGAVKRSFNWNSESVTASVSTDGGDKETRPINMSIDWYIKFA